MDPVSILAITSTTGKIIETCVTAALNLREIRKRWKEAPAMLESIEQECQTIKATIKLMGTWFEGQTHDSIDDDEFLGALLSALQYCLDTVRVLDQSAAQCRGPSFPFSAKKVKVMVNESSLRRCREELRVQVDAATSLWQAITLVAPERRKQVKQIETSLRVYSSKDNFPATSRASIISIDKVDHEKHFAGSFKARLSNVGSGRKSFPSSKSRRNTQEPISRSTPLNEPVVSSSPNISFCCLAAFIIVTAILMGNALLPIIGIIMSPFKSSPSLSASNDALLAAAADGSWIETIMSPFKSSPSLSASNDALLAAAAAGSWKDVSRLLLQGAKPSIRDSRLQTPLHLAAINGNTKTVGILLDRGDTGWFADNNTTPLHLAARNGHGAVVKQISRARGRDWSRERSSDIEAIEKLRVHMGKKFDRLFLDFFKKKTFTARELAVVYGHVDAALSLPRSVTGDIGHALSCACMLGDVHMVEELYNHNKNRGYFEKRPSLQGRSRWFPAPPLHLAVMSGSRATVAFLLEKGWSAKSQTSASGVKRLLTDWSSLPYSSPAHYAAISGSTELLKVLSRKCDLTALDHNLRTPLSYAVEYLERDVVQFLVNQEYPSRDLGLCNLYAGACLIQSYLGAGHVWQDPKLKVDAIPDRSIREALKTVGFVSKDVPAVKAQHEKVTEDTD